MEGVDTIAQLRGRVAEWRRAGLRVGLVPTMGYLHEGHLRLVDRARQEADRVVVSVFVNPLQFRPEEDLARYPRDLDRDRALLGERGADLCFAPGASEMYPAEPTVKVDPGALGMRWEGAVRPGHFTGVLTVVAKLFHQVGPDVACFGQKDVQQAILIRRMVKELDWPVEVIIVPTVREPDGLALSSRNVYLSPADRRDALALSRALRVAHARFAAGERSATVISAAVEQVFRESPAVRADYVAVVDPELMLPVERADADTVVAVAARVGATRLIDNIVLGQGIAPPDRRPTG